MTSKEKTVFLLLLGTENYPGVDMMSNVTSTMRHVVQTRKIIYLQEFSVYTRATLKPGLRVLSCYGSVEPGHSFMSGGGD